MRELLRESGMGKPRARVCARKLADRGLLQPSTDVELQRLVSTAKTSWDYVRDALELNPLEACNLVWHHPELLLLGRQRLEKRMASLRGACTKHFALYPCDDPRWDIPWVKLVRQAPRLLACKPKRFARYLRWQSNLLKQTGASQERRSAWLHRMLTLHPTLFACKLHPVWCLIKNRMRKYGNGKDKAVYRLEMMERNGTGLAAWLQVESCWREICAKDDARHGAELRNGTPINLIVPGNIMPADGLAGKPSGAAARAAEQRRGRHGGRAAQLSFKR